MQGVNVVILIVVLLSSIFLIASIAGIKVNIISKSIYVGIILCLAILALHLNPIGTYDVVRYFQYIDNYGKHSSSSFYLYQSMYLISGAVIWETLCSYVSRLNNPNYLISIVITITYLIMGHILLQYNKKNKCNRLELLLAFIVINAATGVNNIWGALRYTLAYTIVSYSIMLLCVSKRKLKRILVVMLLLIALMIHFSVILYVLLIIIAYTNLYSKKSIKILLCSWSYFVDVLIYFFSKIPLSITQYYAMKLNDYFWKTGEDPRSLIVKIIISILIFYMCHYLRNSQNVPYTQDEANYKIQSMALTISFFEIGTVAIPDIFIRSLGIQSYFTIFLLSNIKKESRKLYHTIALLLLFLSIGLLARDRVSLIHNYELR